MRCFQARIAREARFYRGPVFLDGTAARQTAEIDLAPPIRCWETLVLITAVKQTR